MNKIKQLIKNELKGWKVWELSWMFLAISVIIGLSIYWQDSLMGIVSAATGVACVVCTGKGKLMAYVFGLINCVLYAIISFRSAFYGETMLNALYYVPMQFVGFFVWAKNMNQETGEVEKRHMKNVHRLLWAVCLAVATVLYGLFLKHLGDAMPFVDSFTTVSSVLAMIISVKMYSEQWWLWVGVNVFTIFMWLMDFIKGNDNIATLLMWVVYLINSVVMLIKWEKEISARKVDAL